MFRKVNYLCIDLPCSPCCVFLIGKIITRYYLKCSASCIHRSKIRFLHIQTCNLCLKPTDATAARESAALSKRLSLICTICSGSLDQKNKTVCVCVFFSRTSRRTVRHTCQFMCLIVLLQCGSENNDSAYMTALNILVIQPLVQAACFFISTLLVMLC